MFYEVSKGLGKVSSLVSDDDLVHLQKVYRTHVDYLLEPRLTRAGIFRKQHPLHHYSLSLEMFRWPFVFTVITGSRTQSDCLGYTRRINFVGSNVDTADHHCMPLAIRMQQSGKTTPLTSAYSRLTFFLCSLLVGMPSVPLISPPTLPSSLYRYT